MYGFRKLHLLFDIEQCQKIVNFRTLVKKNSGEG